MKRTILIIFTALSITTIYLTSCGKKEIIPTPVLLPLVEGSEIKYVSFVTDSLKAIQHQLEYLPRHYVRSDEINGKERHFYVENNRLNNYSVLKNGAIETRVQVDIAAFAAAAGLPYSQPVPFSYLRVIFRKEKGFGTSWKVYADTTVIVKDREQQPRTLSFVHEADARLEDWTDLYVPASPKEKLRVLNVHWLHFRNYLYDHTTGDTLWVQRGEGRELFHPEFGLARAMSNYTTRKKGEAAIYRQSTMDLYLMVIPSK